MTTEIENPYEQMNGTVVGHRLSGMVTFRLESGETFELPLIETNQKIGELRARCAEDEKLTNYDYLRMVAEWVGEVTGIPLNMGQADELQDYMEEAYLTKKSERKRRINSMLTSPHSTQ